MDLASALKNIRKDLPLDQQDAAAHLAKYVFNNHQDIKHLTYSRIGQITSINDTPTMLAVIKYCSGSRLELLEMKFELITSEGVFEVGELELNEAKISGLFMHPELGDPVESHEEFIFPFFVPGKGVGADSVAP